MSDRAVRAAEWSAFSTLLDERARNIKENADRTGSRELIAVALAVMGVSADAASLAVQIRGGMPPDPEEEEPIQ